MHAGAAGKHAPCPFSDAGVWRITTRSSCPLPEGQHLPQHKARDGSGVALQLVALIACIRDDLFNI